MLLVLTSIALQAALATARADAPNADAPKTDAPTADSQPAAARVNGAPILVVEVQRSVATALAGRAIPAEARAHLEAEALSQLIDRQLVEQAIDGEQGTSGEVDAAMAKLKAQLAASNRTMADFLRERNLDEAALRDQMAWQSRWERYVRDRMTDRALEAYFRAHRKHFDGTQVRARHILLRADRTDAAATAAVVEEAQRLRQQITSGTLTFEAAARQFSAGPSRAKGGDLGFVPRRGVMVEAFSRAAFDLKPGEVSPPVLTPFGVHLIEVTELRPGKLDWQDVRSELAAPAAQTLFEGLAQRRRATAKIEFTGLTPHYKAGTRELAAAASEK